MIKIGAAIILLGSAVLTCGGAVLLAQGHPRARELGVTPGVYPPGPLNAISDVGGVHVGHTTVIEGDAVRTGVTAVLPHSGNLFQEKVAGAVFIGNAFGKLTGSTQVTELGTIETPIVLTNTLSVGVAMGAVVRYTVGQAGNEQVRSVNARVGETNDGSLNDIRGFHVTRQHILQAIANAKTGPVDEGSVGAGTGTRLYGWKGGIGTSSRVQILRAESVHEDDAGSAHARAEVGLGEEILPRFLRHARMGLRPCNFHGARPHLEGSGTLRLGGGFSTAHATGSGVSSTRPLPALALRTGNGPRTVRASRLRPDNPPGS